MKVIKHEILETLILKPHEDTNDSCFVVYVLYKAIKASFYIPTVSKYVSCIPVRLVA